MAYERSPKPLLTAISDKDDRLATIIDVDISSSALV